MLGLKDPSREHPDLSNSAVRVVPILLQAPTRVLLLRFLDAALRNSYAEEAAAIAFQLAVHHALRLRSHWSDFKRRLSQCCPKMSIRALLIPSGF